MRTSANGGCLNEKDSKLVIASPNYTTRPFDVFTHFPKKNFLWNSEMSVNLKTRPEGRQVADHARYSVAICEYDSPRLSDPHPFGSSLF
jgi:hypothetical protein